MALSDTSIRNAKATDKPQKLADAEGLYLFIWSQNSRLKRN